MPKIKDYLKKNKDVSVALGLRAELQAIQNRLYPLRYCPNWIKEQLNKAAARTDYIVDVMIDYRNKGG